MDFGSATRRLFRLVLSGEEQVRTPDQRLILSQEQIDENNWRVEGGVVVRNDGSRAESIFSDGMRVTLVRKDFNKALGFDMEAKDVNGSRTLDNLEMDRQKNR